MHSTNHEPASSILLPLPLHAFKMAVENASSVASNDMNMEHLLEISNVFASQFNKKEMHDRVICFKYIYDSELVRKDDCDDSDGSHESENEVGSGSGFASSDSFVLPRKKGWRKRSLPLSWSKDESSAATSPVKSARMCTRSSKHFLKELCAPQKPLQALAITTPTVCSNSTTALTSSMNRRSEKIAIPRKLLNRTKMEKSNTN